MQQCHRCGRGLEPHHSREVMNGKVYHLYCFWKLGQQEKERENQLRQECSGYTGLPNNRSKGGTRNPKGSV